MKEENKVEYIEKLRKTAEDATVHRRKQWQELWNLYQGKQDYSKKKDWQSKIFIPKLYMTIEQASSMVKRAVLATSRLFKLKPKDPSDQEAEAARPDAERRFKDLLDRSNFAHAYGNMVKGAFLLGFGVPKVVWSGGLKFTNVDVADVYVDPDFQPYQVNPRYIVETTMMHRTRLRRMASDINSKAGKRIYHIKNIKNLEDDYKDDSEYERKTRKGLEHYRPPHGMVRIDTFWGDVIDDDEGKIQPSRLIQVGNKKFIIRDQANPFIHGRYPGVLTFPLVYPHRGVSGISLVEPIVKMQLALNNTSNMLLDNLNFSVNKMFEVQGSNLVNPKSLVDMYPGKIIQKHTPNETVKEVRTSQVGQDIFMEIEYLSREIEKGTAVTEFLLGTSGRSKTATEAELKTAQAQGLFEVVSRDLESLSLAPLLEMAFDLCIQFGALPKELQGRYSFAVGGLSLLLMQRDQVNSLLDVIMLSLKAPTIGKLVDVPGAVRKWLDSKDLGELFVENPQEGPTPEQQEAIQAKAAGDAKQFVERMGPEQILQFQQGAA